MFAMTTLPVTTTSAAGSLTTAAPNVTDSTVVAVVVVLIVLTLALLGFLFYRYTCQNRGDYRTTGEPAPGDDLDQTCVDSHPEEKKEYFI